MKRGSWGLHSHPKLILIMILWYYAHTCFSSTSGRRSKSNTKIHCPSCANIDWAIRVCFEFASLHWWQPMFCVTMWTGSFWVQLANLVEPLREYWERCHMRLSHRRDLLATLATNVSIQSSKSSNHTAGGCLLGKMYILAPCIYIVSHLTIWDLDAAV